jgi:hypothetical protein
LKTILAKFLLALVGVIFSFAMLEVGLRFLGPPPASAPHVPDNTLHHVKLRNFTFKSYSPDDQFASFPIYWDEEGMVADPEKKLVRDKGRHKRNIALMGDSFVEASQVPYVESFAGLLNKAAAPDVFFLNWGVSSYSPMIYVPLWRNRIRQTHPEHVFLVLYENDTYDDQTFEAKAKFGVDGLPVAVTPVPSPEILNWIRRSSLFRTIRFAWIKVHARFFKADDPGLTDAGLFRELNREITPLTARLLLGLKKEIEASGSSLTVLAVPSRRADMFGDDPKSPPSFASRAGPWLRENGFDYLDLEDAFQNYRKDHGSGNLFFQKDIHFTAAAHRIVADEIRKKYPEYFFADDWAGGR